MTGPTAPPRNTGASALQVRPQSNQTVARAGFRAGLRCPPLPFAANYRMAGMEPAVRTEPAPDPGGGEDSRLDGDFEAYLEAVERCDPADAAEPAAALAELLAARLEGRDHPEARRVLDELAFPGRAAPEAAPDQEQAEEASS